MIAPMMKMVARVDKGGKAARSEVLFLRFMNCGTTVTTSGIKLIKKSVCSIPPFTNPKIKEAANKKGSSLLPDEYSAQWALMIALDCNQEPEKK